MYIVSDKFVEYSREYGRQMHSRLIMDNMVLQDEVISLSKSFDGDLYRTVMQELKGELDGRFDLTDKVIRFQFGLSLNDSAIEWIDYGNFIVKEHERIIVDKNEDKTTLLAYDSMLLTHILYDVEQLNVTYPVSLFNLYKAIATVCGLDVMETSIPNGSMMVNEDKWTNIEDVTYRNILDEISQITGTSIIINDNKLQCKQYEFVKNLTKDDFSDFTAYQGAVVTRNKTFPIDVFKGGRNLIRDSELIDAPLGVGSVGKPVDLKQGETITLSYESLVITEGLPIVGNSTLVLLRRKGTSPPLYIYVNVDIVTKNATVLLSYDVDRVLLYKDVARNTESIKRAGYFTRYKLEKGTLATPYSPAPEDGYGLDLPNGAYHIQGQGNFSNILDLPNAQSNVDVHDWGGATLNGETLVLNETTHYTGSESQLDFNGDLDFIASDPMIYVNHATDNNTIDEASMRSLKIDERVKPFNILNLTREQAHDNYVYSPNWETIPINNRSEIVFADNQIMDKGRETFAQPVFNRIKDVTFTPFQSEPVGTLHMQPLDFINVVDMNNVSHSSLLSTQSLTFNTGSRESVSSLVPKTHKSKYALVTDNRRAFMRVYFLVDQQNGIIEGLIQQIDNVAEATARLTIRVDSIETEVSQVHNGNIINGLNGENDYVDWIGGSNLVYGPGFPHFAENIRYNHGFFVGRSTTSLSESFISFINSGFDISPRGFVIPDIEHSYRGKVEIFKPFSIDLLEYNSSDVLIKTTNHNFPTSTPYIQFTNELTENTMYVRLRFNHENARWNDRIRLTDQMFNRGQPKDWFASAENAMIYSQTTRTQLSDRIDDVVSTVEVIDGQVFVNKATITQLSNEIVLKVDGDGRMVTQALGVNSGGSYYKLKADDISLEGYTTINGHFTVDLQGNVTMRDATMENATITGNLTAGTIAGLLFDGTGIKFPNSRLSLNSVDSSIDFGDMTLKSFTAKDPNSGINWEFAKLQAKTGTGAIEFWTYQNYSEIQVNNVLADSIGTVFNFVNEVWAKEVLYPRIHQPTITMSDADQTVYRIIRDSNGFLKAVV